MACQSNPKVKIGNFTAKTTSIVIPVNTPGYSQVEALNDYLPVGHFAQEILIYLATGYSARGYGARLGIVVLLATCCRSGLSALLGTTEGSPFHAPSLEAIGAVANASVAVTDSMCWRHIANFDVVDAAYKWNLGRTRTALNDETRALLNLLALEFAEYINHLDPKEPLRKKNLVLKYLRKKHIRKVRALIFLKKQLRNLSRIF